MGFGFEGYLFVELAVNRTERRDEPKVETVLSSIYFPTIFGYFSPIWGMGMDLDLDVSNQKDAF